MKHIPVIALLIPLLLSSCNEISSVLVPPGPRQYGTNDYAVGEAQPYPQEVILAKKRLVNFIRRAGPRQRQVLDQNPYVAVQANELVAGDVWPLLRELSSGRCRGGVRHPNPASPDTERRAETRPWYAPRSGSFLRQRAGQTCPLPRSRPPPSFEVLLLEWEISLSPALTFPACEARAPSARTRLVLSPPLT